MPLLYTLKYALIEHSSLVGLGGGNEARAELIRLNTKKQRVVTRIVKNR